MQMPGMANSCCVLPHTAKLRLRQPSFQLPWNLSSTDDARDFATSTALLSCSVQLKGAILLGACLVFVCMPRTADECIFCVTRISLTQLGHVKRCWCVHVSKFDYFASSVLPLIR